MEGVRPWTSPVRRAAQPRPPCASAPAPAPAASPLAPSPAASAAAAPWHPVPPPEPLRLSRPQCMALRLEGAPVNAAASGRTVSRHRCSDVCMVHAGHDTYIEALRRRFGRAAPPWGSRHRRGCCAHTALLLWLRAWAGVPKQNMRGAIGYACVRCVVTGSSG